jgi:hypothetical protein
MSEPTTIAVSWPPLQLGAEGWRRRLEAIADQAEQLIGKPCSLQQTAEMSLELFGLTWAAFSPEVVAETARASLVVGYPGVLAAGRPMDQCAEIAARLDAIWQQAQSDPAAGVVSVPAPLLQHVQKPQTRKRRSRSQAEPETELEPDPDEPVEALEPEPADPVALEPAADPELPPPWNAAPDPEPAPLPERPARQLRPASVRMMRRPVPVEPEPEPDLPEPWRSSEPQPWPPLEADPDPLPVVLTPDSAAPQPQPAPPTSPPPASWLSGGEVAELLGVTRSTVANHRRSGRMGTEGSGWIRHGRTTYFDPAVVERLEQPEAPAGFDQLIAEVQAQ